MMDQQGKDTDPRQKWQQCWEWRQIAIAYCWDWYVLGKYIKLWQVL